MTDTEMKLGRLYYVVFFHYRVVDFRSCLANVASFFNERAHLGRNKIKAPSNFIVETDSNKAPERRG